MEEVGSWRDAAVAKEINPRKRSSYGEARLSKIAEDDDAKAGMVQRAAAGSSTAAPAPE